jgi:hypothetical protein
VFAPQLELSEPLQFKGGISMRVFRLTGSNQEPVLAETVAPKPEPGASEVVIKVHAAGITPTELIWYPTSHNQDHSAAANAYSRKIQHQLGYGKTVLVIPN